MQSDNPAHATTPLLSRPSVTNLYHYDTILNTLTTDDREAIRKMVAENLVARAEEDIKKSNLYRHLADTTEVSAKFFAGITSILAFSATAFPDQNKILSFTAGIVGTVGVVLSGWSQYASKESNERLNRLNAILKGIGLSPISPDPDTGEGSPSSLGTTQTPRVAPALPEQDAVPGDSLNV
jgi:hypothetical protein